MYVAELRCMNTNYCPESLVQLRLPTPDSRTRLSHLESFWTLLAVAESTPLSFWLCSVPLWGVLLIVGLLVDGLLVVGWLIVGWLVVGLLIGGLFIVELRKVMGDCVSIASKSLKVGSRL